MVSWLASIELLWSDRAVPFLSALVCSLTAALTLESTRTRAKVRNCVTQPPRSNQARIMKYLSLWSLLGISDEYGRGVPLSACSIFGREGSVGNADS